MAGQGGNRQHFEYLSAGGLSQSPHRAQNPDPTPVACRLCGEVFLDNWALIDHVGVHMSLDEATSRMRSETNRLFYPREVTLLNPNPPCYYLSFFSNRPTLQAQQGHPVPTTRREMNPFVGGINPIGALSPANNPRGVPQVERGNSHHFRSMSVPSPPSEALQVAPKELSADRTQPFLDQLEQRLAMEMKCRNGRKDVVDAESSSAVLDLTLKL